MTMALKKPGARFSTFLRQQFELLGIDMMDAALRGSAVPTLLMPLGLRVSTSEDAAAPDPKGRSVDWHEVALFWDEIDPEERDPNATVRCMWDFVDLSDAPEGGVVEAVVKFVETWGLLHFGESKYMEFRDGWLEVAEFYVDAIKLRALLVTMAATEAEELVGEGTLKDMVHVTESGPDFESGQDYESTQVSDYVVEHLGGGIEGHQQARREFVLENWRRERAEGRGLDLQRRLVENGLHHHLVRLDPEVAWDKRGRHVKTASIGVKEIIASHLLTLFAASQLDVFTCSICGKPFQCDLAETRRRPRRGARRYCSPECRSAGKRLNNLAAWHRNKSQWRGR